MNEKTGEREVVHIHLQIGIKTDLYRKFEQVKEAVGLSHNNEVLRYLINEKAQELQAHEPTVEEAQRSSSPRRGKGKVQ